MIVDGPAGAEINSMGRVVFGYNLRVTTAGDYVIEYTFPGVEITSSNFGTIGGIDGSMVSLTITVGGGGGGGRRP